MENLDGAVIATALPQMARSFGTQAVDLNISVSAYMLAIAVFIPISGWMGDRFGARNVFERRAGLADGGYTDKPLREWARLTRYRSVAQAR